MNTEPELWRPLTDYPNYQVSNLGNVRNARRTRAVSVRTDRHGYRVVDLWREGKRRTLGVHQLVLHSFHGPAPPGAQGRHLDGNKLNNSPHNLRWGSRRENEDDKEKHLLERMGLTGTVLAGSTRTRVARTLLENGVSVGDVVRELGYSSLKHLSDCMTTLKR